MPTCAGSKGSAVKSDTDRIARWLILLFACWVSFGVFYAFDNPAALNRQLEFWLDIDKETFGFQFMLFYSIYSIPNIFIPFLIGGLLDIYGTNSLLIILSLLVCIGQGIFALGGQLKIFSIMLLGRVIFGIGGESLAVAQARLITDWFSGNELCLAIGIALAVSRIGQVLNNVLSPIIHDCWSLPTALWAGFGSCLLSYGLTYISVILNRRLSTTKIAPICSQIECSCPISAESLTKPLPTVAKPLSIKELIMSIPIIVRTFHPAFFLLCGACFAFNGSIIPFNNIASDFLQRKWYSTSPSMAAWTMSIPDSMAIFLIPLFGYAIDYFGYKVVYLVFGGSVMALGHFLLSSNISSPITPLILNGFGFSCTVAIWPCIPSLVPELYWATAYGIITAIINASTTIIPLCVAMLENMDPTYSSVQIFFSLQSILGSLLSLLFYVSRRLPASKTSIRGTNPSSPLELLTQQDNLPRAPSLSGPPESLFILLDGDNEPKEAADFGLDVHCLHIDNQYHKDEWCQRTPQFVSRITVNFRDDTQIEHKALLNYIFRKRGNSAIEL